MGAFRIRNLIAGLPGNPIHGGIRGVFSKLVAAAFILFPAANAQIYADVTTSAGSFTIELNHAAAPRTVANFVSLAEGSRPWVDPVTGAIRTQEPFYNGVIFHRVIANFMSQTGSRKGDGSDGPGYNFPDEVNNGLTHSAPHVVSMANSGTNTNGSQFFITDVATPHLNGLHTVFGKISGGGAVVDAINNVPTTNDRPVTPVVIQSVTIRREGSAAPAFDIHAQNLPEVSVPGISLDVQVGGNLTAKNSPALAPRTFFRASRSFDLISWASRGGLYLGRDEEEIEAISGIETAAPSKAFYHFTTIHYPDDSAFSNQAGATYVVTYPAQSRSYVFNAAGTGGIVTITPGSGAPVQQPFTLRGAWNSPYRLQLEIDHGSAGNPRYLRHTLHADTGSGNTWGGRMVSDQLFINSWFSWNSGSFNGSR